jgi:hypothetical protein
MRNLNLAQNVLRRFFLCKTKNGKGMKMKKLMAILFVLALVNIANAGYVDLQISSVGPSETETQPITPVKSILIMPSMWVDIDVVYYPDPGRSIFSISKEMVITGAGVVSIGGQVSTPGNPLLLTWPAGWNPDFSKVTMLPNGNPLIDTLVNDYGSVQGPIVLDHFLLHTDGPELVTVKLVENPNTGAMESLELDADWNLYHIGEGPGIIMPEPMTITLLGLGGLAILMKRRI